MAVSFLTKKPDSGLGNIRSSPGAPSRNIDWVLMGTQVLLSTIGLFVIFSASRFQIEGDPYAFVNRQVVFAIIAAAAMAIVMSIQYEWFRDHAAVLYWGTNLSLVLLLALKFATGEAIISFDLGPFNIQPAEIAKFSTLVALAAYLGNEDESEVTYPRFLTGLMIVGIPAGLVILQPDLGSASVLIAIAMGVLLVAGAKVRYIVMITSLSISSVVIAYFSGFVSEYQATRLKVFFDQDSTDPALRDDTFQVRNAIRAAGTGGFWGKGYLNGELTNRRYVPVMWADFPFAAVGEQFGFIGGMVILGLFMILLVRVWRIATLSKDLFGTYVCAGTFTIILWQMFQNIGMTVGILPVTGLPLPFISYGGSGLITISMMLGLVQSVHMRRMR